MKWDFVFRPELVETPQNNSRQGALQDIAAAVRFGKVALPPGMAFAIARV
jgi:MFS superfamily sulfate permease-like transporter